MLLFRHCFADEIQLASYLAKMAIRALYAELALYPKPGLVSFIDSGAHDDMNGSLFVKSLFTLRHYFKAVSLHAAKGNALPELVMYGLAAEQTNVAAY